VGSSAGIGRAFAALVASNPKNYRLVAAARKTSALQFLPESENILKVTLDITSPDAIKDAVRRATDTFGRIDVFVNNAGYSLLGDTESTTDAQARALFETLFWGATNLTREALRVMREDNTKTGNGGGVVVYMSSPGGRVSLPGGSYYYAA
jgi:NAD(P)-dependent dehydrogenase (short-subunit alcohol dehydrogenase family)